MIIDYNNRTSDFDDFIPNHTVSKKPSNDNGIYVKNITKSFSKLHTEDSDAYSKIHLNDNGNYENITFRNFPEIHIQNSVVAGCTFERCGTIELSSCAIRNCIFNDVSSTYANLSKYSLRGVNADDSTVTDCTFEHGSEIELTACFVSGCIFDDVISIDGNASTDFSDCTFKNCHCDGSVLIVGGDNGKGSVQHCTFINVSATGEDSYIIDCIYSKKKDVRDIVDCRFENCTVENEDQELTRCSYFVPLSSIKTKQINNFDYDTCVVVP